MHKWGMQARQRKSTCTVHGGEWHRYMYMYTGCPRMNRQCLKQNNTWLQNVVFLKLH